MTASGPRTAVAVADPIPNSVDGIRTAARAAVPRLRALAERNEQERRLCAQAVEILRGTGVFRMGFPRELGGPGLTSTEQVEIIETLSRGDTAAGWCAMIGMDAGLYGLSDAAVRDMFPDLDVIAAGMLPPAGRADRVPGGFRLTGRWGFASGIAHADWVSSGAFVVSDGAQERTPEGRPYWRILMVRPDQVELIDNWHATGLAGSGSVDYTISDVFVPEAQTFGLGEPSRTGPLAAPDALMRKMPAVGLGAAREALTHARDVLCAGVDPGTDRSYAHDHRAQVVVAECEQELAAARRAVYGSLQERWDRLLEVDGLDALSRDERVATMLTRVAAMRTARAVVRRLHDLLGSTATPRSSRMDRWLRDMETMCQHVMAQDRIVQSAGRTCSAVDRASRWHSASSETGRAASARVATIVTVVRTGGTESG